MGDVTYVLGTGPMTMLARVGHLDALAALSEEVLVPERVYRPFAEHSFQGAPPARRVERAADDEVFRVFSLPEGVGIEGQLRENPRLTRADAATLALADYADGIAISDTTYVRKIARVEGIDARGTAYLVLQPVREGGRPPPTALHLIETLLEAGWNPAPNDYAEILDTLNELS